MHGAMMIDGPLKKDEITGFDTDNDNIRVLCKVSQAFRYKKFKEAS